MELVKILTLPLRVGITVAEISLGIAELTVTTIRVIATNSGATAAGAASLADPHGPMQMIRQLSSLTADGRPIGQALAAGGPLERLIAEGGPLDQIVALSDTLTSLAPRLERMNASITMLQDTVEILSAAVEPLGELAGKLPNGGSRARTIGWTRRDQPPGITERSHPISN